jgi:hypothetical protein
MKKITTGILLGATGIALFMASCSGDSKKNTTTETKDSTTVNVPDFNADSAYLYTKTQVDFGSRVNNSEAHRKCGEYLIKKLKSFADTVIVQQVKLKAFDGKILDSKNIVASFNPGTNNRIFISSHWDSRPFADYDPDKANFNKPIPGANDGASGVGVIIELARLLRITKANIGVDLVLFDAEDYGQPNQSALPETEDTYALGAQYWAKNPHKKDYFAKYGILLDMVGGKNATFTKEGTSMQYAPDIMKKVWDIAIRAGYSDFFLNSETGAITDDHLYVNMYAKIPTIDIIQRDSRTKTGFFEYWHTLKDDMDCIDKNTLKAVGQTMAAVIYQER